jgi:hypothetical protein
MFDPSTTVGGSFMATAQQDLIGTQRAEIDARMAELAPLVAEFAKLEQAAAALDTIVSTGNGSSSTQRSTARVKAAGPAKTATPKAGRGRPKGSGKRGEQATAIVAAHPEGIKVSEIATEMGIKQNYLYRVLPELATEGKVIKGAEGRWFPAEQGSADASVQ